MGRTLFVAMSLLLVSKLLVELLPDILRTRAVVALNSVDDQYRVGFGLPPPSATDFALSSIDSILFKDGPLDVLGTMVAFLLS